MPNFSNSLVSRFLMVWTAALLLGPLAIAASDVPSFEKGEDYGAVRAKMIKAGWKPFHAPDADTCGAGDSRCTGRPEMVACAGTGLANCKFLWKKGARMLALCTAGELTARLDVVCQP
jgi:hypothetical protein